MNSMDVKQYLCNKELKQLINANLARFERIRLSADNLRKAAVALTIVDYRGMGALPGLLSAEDDAAALILTRRSAMLKNHAGQWAFPGGRIDQGESPQQAALRELYEEVGLQLTVDRVIGCLDDFVTRSGFLITPVVIWGGVGINLVANEKEVASIHRIPCRELLREDAPILSQRMEAGGQPVLSMPVGNSSIATPTAAMLYQFREVALVGCDTRVAHFEQPYFAWQ